MGIEKDRETGVEVLSFSKDEMWSLLDGRLHTLVEGRDYPIGTAFADVRKRIRQGAWRRGVLVKIQHLGDKILLQSSDDSNQHADSIRAMNRPQWSKERIENYDLAQETARLQVRVQELEQENARILREFSAYRLEHPIR